MLQRQKNAIVYVTIIWLLSRLLIVAAIQLAPFIAFEPPAGESLERPDPVIGWELFAHWDGEWYRQIATEGYTFVRDGKQHSTAFFPLFPLMVRLVMFTGLSFEPAAFLINALSFWAALYLLYQWVEERQNKAIARWAVATLAWLPMSLFTVVAYTETLFILCTTAALKAFDEQNYRWASFWGILSGATRVPGFVLVPTFLLTSVRQKRPWIAYLVSCTPALGLAAYGLYCLITFQNPLAFYYAQEGWAQLNQGWMGLIVAFFHSTLATLIPIVPGDVLQFHLAFRVFIILGGVWLLAYYHRRLGFVGSIYTLCSLSLFFYSGNVISVHRFIYGVVPISIALAIFLSHHPKWGYLMIAASLPVLIWTSIRFAHFGFVG